MDEQLDLEYCIFAKQVKSEMLERIGDVPIDEGLLLGYYEDGYDYIQTAERLISEEGFDK